MKLHAAIQRLNSGDYIVFDYSHTRNCMTLSMLILILMRLLARTSRANAFAMALLKPHLADVSGLAETLTDAQKAPDEFKKAVRQMLNALAASINRPLVKMIVLNVVLPLLTDAMLDKLWDTVFGSKVEAMGNVGDELMDASLAELV